jgi:hypothetical protein
VSAQEKGLTDIGARFANIVRHDKDVYVNGLHLSAVPPVNLPS